MSEYVIIGAGPVGTELANLAARAGHRVTTVTRSGRGPEIAGVRRVAADASDADRLTEIATGADVIFNAANPSSYGSWEKIWPPLWSSILQATERTGALLVIASSLYGYGPVDTPMTEDLPDAATEKNGRIRAGMWAEAKQLHDQGRIRAVEVRASDYVGSNVLNGHLTRNVAAALQGKPVRVFGDPDLPHSWTDVLDVARTLAAVAERPDSWGRVWIAPTNPPRSHREALADVLAAAGKPMVPMRSLPAFVVTAAALVNADMRALHQMRYIFDRPYVVDSTAAETELGLAPTPWSEVVRRSLDQPGVSTDDHAPAGQASSRTAA